MSDDKSIIVEISDFLDSFPLDYFIAKLDNRMISLADTPKIEEVIAKVKLNEGKLRKLRQQIEYQVRKHRLQAFREDLNLTV